MMNAATRCHTVEADSATKQRVTATSVEVLVPFYDSITSLFLSRQAIRDCQPIELDVVWSPRYESARDRAT